MGTNNQSSILPRATKGEISGFIVAVIIFAIAAFLMFFLFVSRVGA